MDWTQKYRAIGRNRVLEKINYSKMSNVSPIGIFSQERMMAVGWVKGDDRMKRKAEEAHT